MNRDPATSPQPTEPFPKRDAAGRQSPRQTESATQAVPAATIPLVVTEPLVPKSPAESAQPATGSHSEHLRQLEALTALLDRELRKSDPARPRATPPAAPPAMPPVQSPQQEAAETSPDEESLQSCLDRFMERVSGKKAEAEPVAPGSVPQTTLAPTPVTVPPAAAAPPPVEVTRVLRTAPTQQREPIRAPEYREKLSAMRDLANENARTAMNLHAGRHVWRRTKAALLLATAATTISSALAIWNLATAAPGTAESAACTGLIAVYLACRFYWRSRSLAALI